MLKLTIWIFLVGNFFILKRGRIVGCEGSPLWFIYSFVLIFSSQSNPLMDHRSSLYPTLITSFEYVLGIPGIVPGMSWNLYFK